MKIPVCTCQNEIAAMMVAVILHENPELSEVTAAILQEYLRARKKHPC